MITVYETADELEDAASDAGVSMRVVCAKAGLAHTTWYRWKNANTIPTLTARVRFAEAIEALKQDGRR